MRRLGGVIAVAALTLLAGCGGDETSQAAGTDFSPLTAEGYVRVKTRANVQSHPALVQRDLTEPDVNCVEVDPDEDTPTGTARFRCQARVSAEEGGVVAHETWEVVVGQEPTTGDLTVRSARRTDSNIPSAPQP